MEEISLQEMVKRMIKMRDTHKQEVERVLPISIGNDAVNLFVSNFDKQGFDTGNGVEKWPEVQRRLKGLSQSIHVRSIKTHQGRYKNPSGNSLSSQLSAILVRSGKGKRAVHNSLRTPRVTGGKIIIPFEVASDYMGYHNYGGSIAGRPPKREFMGPSAALDKIIAKNVSMSFNRIFTAR